MHPFDQRPLYVLVLSAMAGAAQAQTSDALLKPQQEILNILWEAAASPSDRLSTNDAAEARRLGPLGQMYYVAGSPSRDTMPLLRLRAASGDHRADVQPAAGYLQEGTLGYLWTARSHPPGTAPIWFAFDPRTGDYGLAWPDATPKGYRATAAPEGYAWARRSTAAPLLTLTGKQVAIGSNLAAGGALWSLTWHGQQFIDQVDYGRGVQSSLSFYGPGASKALPTEAGDQTADPDARFMHGAPLLAAANKPAPSGAVQSTRAIPLEWRNTDFDGGQPTRVVAYPRWQIGKEISVDDARLALGADHPEWPQQVMRYTTLFDNGGPPLPQADIEIPTAYLRPAFRRAYTCDATATDTNRALREVTSAQYQQLEPGTWHYQFDVSAGGVILANDALTHALGIYASRPEGGGSARYFTLWKFGASAAPTVTKASAAAGPLTLQSGENRFHSWLVVGQAREVCAIMQRLYASGLR